MPKTHSIVGILFGILLLVAGMFAPALSGEPPGEDPITITQDINQLESNPLITLGDYNGIQHTNYTHPVEHPTDNLFEDKPGMYLVGVIIVEQPDMKNRWNTYNRGSPISHAKILE